MFDDTGTKVIIFSQSWCDYVAKSYESGRKCIIVFTSGRHKVTSSAVKRDVAANLADGVGMDVQALGPLGTLATNGTQERGVIDHALGYAALLAKNSPSNEKIAI